jgi:hypothetical protein
VQWLCGDDAEAKATVASLITESGFVPVDVGGTADAAVMEVADEADDVLRDQAPDGAAGVHADHDPAVGVEHEPGRLQEQRIVVDERADRIGDRQRVGAVTDRKLQAMLGDQLVRGVLVVHRQRHDRDVHLGQAVKRPLERAELGVAVRAPGPSVEQHDAEVSHQGIRQTERTAAGKVDGEGRERVVGCSGVLSVMSG